jgi:hypothetical protein
MTLSGTINKTLILFYCLPHQPGDLVDDFNGMNPIVPTIGGHCRFNFGYNFRFQTAFLI